MSASHCVHSQMSIRPSPNSCSRSVYNTLGKALCSTLATTYGEASPNCESKLHADLRWVRVKKGCLRASKAVNRSEGSYFRSPFNRSIKSPAEWSTCCITRFWRRGSFETALMLSLDAAPSGQSSQPLLTYFPACESALLSKCWGKGPNTLSIMAKCSKFSWVWNNASPEQSSTRIQPTLHISQG